MDWQKKSYTFSGAGTKTLKWVYSGGSSGQNCGWVDGLVIGSGSLIPPPDGYYSEALDSDLKFTTTADNNATWRICCRGLFWPRGRNRIPFLTLSAPTVRFCQCATWQERVKWTQEMPHAGQES